jgi:hypothetical protein
MPRRRIISKNNIPILSLDQVLSQGNNMNRGVTANKIMYTEKNYCNDDIYLISQFFLHKDTKRRQEISYCLQKNCDVFSKIFLLNEREYSIEELQVSKENFEKIEQIVIGKRISYKNFLDFCKNKNLSGYCILSNSDIFFDTTVNNLRKGFLNREKSIYALSRHEINSEGEISEKFMVRWSQDAWIIHSNHLLDHTEKFDIILGKPGCDNKILYVFFENNFKIYNCPYFIKIFHYHEDKKRDYTSKDTIPPPYIHAEPVKNHQKINLVENSHHITEDSIADWVHKKNGIMLTRKYNTIKNIDLFSKYVCLTGTEQVLNFFEHKILPKLQNKIILIIIESDIIKISKNIINSDVVTKIFQWNKEIDHPKIKCIPIGLNRDRQLSVMMNTPKPEKKDKLILLNFDVNSHPIRRKIAENKELMSLCSKMDYLAPENLYYINTFTNGKLPIHITNKNYYKELGKYKFVLSPRGGGEDCHRTWEALYMGCIPIVLSSSIDEIYEDLPVLIVKCWSEITEELLNKTLEEYQKKEWNMEKLTMNYWFNQFEYNGQSNKRHIIVTTTNENKTYCGFVPSVYQMWKKNYPECHFVLGVISNKEREDSYIKRLEEFSDDFYLFKQEEGIESGVQAKVSRLYLSTLYNEDVVTIVDVDQYIFDFEWLKQHLIPAFNRRFVSVAYEAYIRTPDRGKWPMPYTSAPSDIFKKIVNYNNIKTYTEWLDSLRKIKNPIDNKESVENKFDRYSDESTLRHMVETHPERKYIYSIWEKVKRKDATVYNEAHRRLDRWNWDKQFSELKLLKGYFIDCWPVRSFEENYKKLEPLLKYMNLDLSKDKIFLERE